MRCWALPPYGGRMVEPARTAGQHRGPRILAALVVVGALVGVVAYQSLAPSSSTAAAPVDVLRSEPHGAAGPAGLVPDRTIPSLSSAAPSPIDGLGAAPPRAIGEADGVVPDGTTVFDDIPAVTNLRPDLLDALRHAATDAARDGVQLFVESGWRSARYQQALLQQAISKYGSEAEARRWVATPSTSAHVSGRAVDIGPARATAWLSGHGASYGLCQIYDNEPWHYELRPDAIHHGCPPMYADPSHDPRMQQ